MRQNFLVTVAELPRFQKRFFLIAFDIVALAVALWASYALRYGSWMLPSSIDELATALSAPLVAIPIFVKFGLYRAVIRYLPERALWTIVQAMTVAALAWVMLTFLVELIWRGHVPRSVPIIYWALGTMIISASRFAAKRIMRPARWDGTQDRPMVIYGAGEAGVQLAASLRLKGRSSVVGFIDDNPNLTGRDVSGLRVYAPSSLGMLVQQFAVGEVVLSMPSVDSSRRQEIVEMVSKLGLHIRTLPPISDLISGKYAISEIREIDIDDLLGRSSVPADPRLLQVMIEGRSIMVTGAGGSIGSELCRLIAHWKPQRLVLFEANEFALYNIERELVRSGGTIIPVLGSVTNKARVDHALQFHNVDVVFHAAAHKHVPMVEANALEGIYNNVIGTKVVADAAFEHGVKNFVLISTDKAVRPTNVMGATKRWAELIVHQKSVQAQQIASGQLFSAVRFGNVLGSNGSVVPLFKEQIAAGGPVTLTDEGMTRYFMSIHEAAELIVQAGALSQGGDMFLLDMGEPILIKSLAENMIRLAGLTVRNEANPEGRIEIVVTGKRPGEKMFEELFYDEASATATQHPKILRAAHADQVPGDISAALPALEKAMAEQNEPEARKVLFALIQGHFQS
jgi:Predicted nucleoside-diphosphate sugar epimerases